MAPPMRGPGETRARALRALALLVLAAVALGIRCLWVPETLGDAGEVYLPPADAAYHARRALWSLVRFPEILSFDPYLAYPDGAVVPMPPLYDWLLGAAARALGGGERTFELVLAWVSPLAGALAVAAVHGLGRAYAGGGVALGAAVLYATLPVAVGAATFGDADHHASVALLGALQLLAILRLLVPGASAARVAGLAGALAALRALLALVWSGSLLYLGVGEAALALGAAASGGRARLWLAQAGGCAGAALLLAPWVLSLPTPPGGAFSTTTLSGFHVAALAAAALVLALAAGADGALARLAPQRRRAVLAAAAGAGVLAAAAAAYAARDALSPALAFLGKQDVWGGRNLEQRPLFGWLGGGPAASAVSVYGLLAYLVPLAWLAPLLDLRDPARRPRALALSTWLLAFGALTSLQSRFGSDFAPAGCVGFALVIAAATRPLLAPLGRTGRAAAAAALGAVLVAPGLAPNWPRKLPDALAWLREPQNRPTARRTLAEFGARVRAATPETDGFLGPGRPEYAILCRPAFGHSLLYGARRATPAGNFGPYVGGAERYERARAFYEARAEADAVAQARALGVRYVVTTERGSPGLGLFADRLHATDGSALAGAAHAERFRLVADAPEGGISFSWELAGRRPRTPFPYKLFELVEGAVLAVRAAPGAEVRASATVRTAAGRSVAFEAVGRAGADGVARLRVPYATGAGSAARLEAPYRVRAGASSGAASVGEADVREGRELAVPLSGPASAATKNGLDQAAPPSRWIARTYTNSPGARASTRSSASSSRTSGPVANGFSRRCSTSAPRTSSMRSSAAGASTRSESG
jgi:dolichyl-diphosphooligosaccharide--protein glycosyltransferase